MKKTKQFLHEKIIQKGESLDFEDFFLLVTNLCMKYDDIKNVIFNLKFSHSKTFELTDIPIIYFR